MSAVAESEVRLCMVVSPTSDLVNCHWITRDSDDFYWIVKHGERYPVTFSNKRRTYTSPRTSYMRPAPLDQVVRGVGDNSQDHPYCPEGWIVVREPPDITNSRAKSLGRPIFHIADYGTDLDAQEAMYEIFCPQLAPELASNRHSENVVSNERDYKTFPTPPTSPALTPISYPTPLEHRSSSSGRVQAPSQHTSTPASLEMDLSRNAALRPPRVTDLGTTAADLSTTGATRAQSRSPYPSGQQYQGNVSSASSIIMDSSVVPTPRPSVNSSSPPGHSTQSSRKRVRSDIEVEEVVEDCRAPRRQRTDAWGFARGFAIGTAVGAAGTVAALISLAPI
jgi:hypothetical protein